MKKEGYQCVDMAADCSSADGEDYMLTAKDFLMVHIRHLREKLEENPSKPEHLLIVRGLGYKLK